MTTLRKRADAPRRTGRRRRDTTPASTVLRRAALTVAGVCLLAGLGLTIYHGVPWVSYKTLYAVAPETGDLLPHDPIRIAGVRVGQVSTVSLTRAGDARLRLQIYPATKLPTGTTFSLRADGLLGARYVQLIPGQGASELPDGATLRGNSRTLTSGVPDALSVFNSQTRGALGKMINGLGLGTFGRGAALGQTIQEIAAESRSAQQLVAGLIGPGQLGRLVPAMQSMMAPLADARATVAAMLTPASDALQPFVSQRAAVRAAIDQAPGTLSAARAGLASGEQLLSAADLLSVQVHEVLPLAPGGLQATTKLLRTSHPALASADRLLSAARPAVPALLRVTGALSPDLSPLAQLLGRATPISNQVSPYGCNIENFGSVIRSMTGFGGSAAVPGGPGGPAMAFRLEVIPAGPTQMLGTKDTTLIRRVGYSAPCSYLSSSYPTSTSPTTGLGG